MSKTALCLLAFLLFPLAAHAEEKDRVIENARARYEDFFARLQRQEDEERRRLSGREDIKEQRQKEDELRERARKNFVATRPTPIDSLEEEKKELIQKAEAQKAYLKVQEDYALKQRALERIKQGAWKIPPVQEYQLQEAL